MNLTHIDFAKMEKDLLEVVDKTEIEKDPYTELASLYYNINYDVVTIEQRNELKKLYYLYKYNPKPKIPWNRKEDN